MLALTPKEEEKEEQEPQHTGSSGEDHLFCDVGQPLSVATVVLAQWARV